ncbi:HD domain-containing protein [Rubrobacter tropicus]|uniref:HD domain-containing protein n=1 Tax=Rubrobacter tropicus TaxID=2653851 RepID=A0A6G8Q7J9_9ACTN|nr:HD domain-containing protein [Rubrobacter tropicus]QIN82297.1 HD domain-containing protein [Rubrobacter tropicus]
MRTREALFDALEPPVDPDELLDRVPELSLARGLEGSPYHHLDTLDHVLEVIRRVEQELEENRLGALVPEDGLDGLRLAALLHDVAKPVTRGELEGRVLFVAHDSLGAALVRRICRRLDLPARETDLAATLTALHLKIGFMQNGRTDTPPDRLARAAGIFGEELAVLSLADRLAAQGPRLKPEHIDRHVTLCADFLEASRDLGPYPEPDYQALATNIPTGADAGYAASQARLFAARGLDPASAIRAALSHVASLL